MRRLPAVLLVLACSAVSAVAEPAWERLPDGVVAAVEVRDVHTLGPRLQDAVRQVHPLFNIPPAGPALAAAALKTYNYVSLDLESPFRIILPAPPLHTAPVMLYRAHDPHAYIDSLFRNIEREKFEDDIHHLREELDSFDPSADSPAPGRPLYVGFVGQTAAMGRELEAVQAAMDMLRDGALTPDPLFEGDAGAVLRLGSLLEGLEQVGQDPLGDLRRSIEVMPLRYPAQREALERNVRALETLLRQVEAVSADGLLGRDAFSPTFAMKPVPGSGIADYTAQMPAAEQALLPHLPAGALAAFAGGMGDMGPMVDWFLDQWPAMPPEEADPEVMEEAARVLRAWTAAIGGRQFAVAVYGEPGESATVAQITDVDDPDEALELGERLMAAIGPLAAAGPGMRMSMEALDELPPHRGHRIFGWRTRYDFELSPGLPPGTEQLQRALVEGFYGPEPMTYAAAAHGHYLTTFGADALEVLKAMIEGPEEALSESPELAEALREMPDGAVAVGYLSPGGLAGWYVEAVRQATEGADPLLPPGPVQFRPGPPVGVAAYVGEEGVLQVRVRVPFGSLRVLVDGILMGIIGAEQMPRMPPGMP